MFGLAMLFYAILFLLVDAVSFFPQSMRRAAGMAKVILFPLQWLGENCIFFFVFSDCFGVLDWLLRFVTWGKPYSENNVVAWFQNKVLMQWLNLGGFCPGSYAQCGPAVMTFVWIEILFWILVCGLLHPLGVFWKI
eukprot:UN2867